MAFIPVPDVAMVEFIYTLNGQRCENTIYVEAATPFNLSTLNELAEGMDEWDEEVGSLVRVAGSVLVAINVTALDSNTAPAVERIVSPGRPGARTGSVLPGNVTMCVTFVTAQRGRSFRGRNYVVGLNETDVVGNNVDGGTVDGYIGYYEDLQEAISTLGWQMVVVSRYSNNAPRNPGISVGITSFKADEYVDSQRRRLTGRGT